MSEVDPDAKFTPVGFENVGHLPHLFRTLNFWADGIYTKMRGLIRDQVEQLVASQDATAWNLVQFGEEHLSVEAHEYRYCWNQLFEMPVDPHNMSIVHPKPFLILETRFKVGFAAYYDDWQKCIRISMAQQLEHRWKLAETAFLRADFETSISQLLEMDAKMREKGISFESLSCYLPQYPRADDTRYVVMHLKSSSGRGGLLKLLLRGLQAINSQGGCTSLGPFGDLLIETEKWNELPVRNSEGLQLKVQGFAMKRVKWLKATRTWHTDTWIAAASATSQQSTCEHWNHPVSNRIPCYLKPTAI